jgi:hypothetical protein
MNKIRKLLEEIKSIDDAQREATGKPPEEAMLLYPPAAPDAAKKLLNGGWSHPLPPSFGDFLAASDGVTRFPGQLDFLSTDGSRQGPIRAVVDKRIEQDKINLRAMFKTVDDAVIKQWESDPNKLYVANHPVIAARKLGSLLFYDSRTRNAQGEMELCWRPAMKATIENRYENIEKYLEATLQAAREKARV